MKKILVLLFVSAFAFINAQDVPLWMRSAAISPDGSQIVFTYKGDLYKVSSNGGNATQLTYHEAHDHKAVWSNNGQTLAFASDRYGNYDVYTMSANGGPANRITFHSNSEIPYTFTNDDENVIFGGIRQDDSQGLF